MPKRQRVFLQIGCYLAFLTAAMHMFGYATGFQPENPTEKQLLDQASSYHFQMPGGSQRSLMDLMDGFSLLFPLFLATTAGLGLMVSRRGAADPTLANAIIRTLAGAYVVLTVISITKFFIIPTACVAVVTLSFLAASVRGSRDA